MTQPYHKLYRAERLEVLRATHKNIQEQLSQVTGWQKDTIANTVLRLREQAAQLTLRANSLELQLQQRTEQHGHNLVKAFILKHKLDTLVKCTSDEVFKQTESALDSAYDNFLGE